MLEAILEGTLKPEHKKAGMFLSEEDDHTVSLFKTVKGWNRRIAVFTSFTTPWEIQRVADKYINETPPPVSIEKEEPIVFNSFKEFEIAAEEYCRNNPFYVG